MKLINIASILKTGKSIIRLFFLTVLLIGNVIGFHYYHMPVATGNLRYLPSNASFIFTVNLKNISGTLLQEIIFSPEGFEKEVISKSERKLIVKNANLGLNPFGLVSFFRFNYQNKVLNGISINLENSDTYAEYMRENNYQFKKVDEVRVFYNDEQTHFVFEKAAVILFSPLNDKEKDALAGQFLLNENGFDTELGKGHFTFYAQKGLVENTILAPYFRMVPGFAESLYVSGVFGKSSIHLNGKINANDLLAFKEEISFGEMDQPDDAAYMQFGFSGSALDQIFASYLGEKLDLTSDSTAVYSQILEQKYNGFTLSMKDLKLPFDMNAISNLMQGDVIPPLEYTLQLNLTAESPDRAIVDYNFPLPLKVGNDTKRKVFCRISEGNDKKPNQAYFYFNPVEFVANANLNILVESLVEPFLIFEDVLLKGEQFKDGELSFGGELSFQDKEKHSLVQMRQLIKDFTSIL